MSYSLFYFKHTHFPQENQRDPNLSCFLEKPVFDPDVPTDYPGGQIYTIGRLKIIPSFVLGYSPVNAQKEKVITKTSKFDNCTFSFFFLTNLFVCLLFFFR